MSDCWICGRSKSLIKARTGVEGGVKTAVVEYGGEEIEVDLCFVCFSLLKGDIQD